MSTDPRQERNDSLNAPFVAALEAAAKEDPIDRFVEDVLLRVASAVEKGDSDHTLVSDLGRMKEVLREALL